MSLVEIVETVINKSMDELAAEIQGELKALAPGRAGAVIATEVPSAATRRIGAHPNWGDPEHDGGVHLYYYDQGNGGRGAIIRSKRKYDRRGRPPGKLELRHMGEGIFRNYVHGYEGKHIIKAVADRHR